MDPCWQICLAGKEKEKKRNQSLEWKAGTGKNEVGVGERKKKEATDKSGQHKGKEKEAKDKYEQGKRVEKKQDDWRLPQDTS